MLGINMNDNIYQTIINTPDTEEVIISFIHKFTKNNSRKEVVECFSKGCCYWFAFILSKRFIRGYIVCDEVANHYGFFSSDCNMVFDITGNVTHSFNWDKWDNVMAKDNLLSARLFRDCIAMYDFKD
jgi:hypothetical protein